MEQMKSTIPGQRHPVGKQSPFKSVQEDGDACLKHMVGYASPKLTPKHSRSVKQSKRKTKNHESPRFEFPPPPSYPPPEHYNLSDEYSADLIDADVPSCKTDYNLNDNLVRFRANGDDQPPEGFWNSPVEAPWGYFIGSTAGGKDTDMADGWIRDGEKVMMDGEEGSEFWCREEGGWVFKNVESSTPFMERKNKMKKKGRKCKVKEDTAQLSEEIMLINKLKEESNVDEEGNEFQGFRNEIWINGPAPPPTTTTVEDLKSYQGLEQDSSTIKISKNHISNVLITHGNDEALDNFIENKPIHNSDNGETNFEVHLINNYPEKEDVESGQVEVTCSGKENDVSDMRYRECSPRREEAKPQPTDNGKYHPKKDLTLLGDSPDEYSYAYYEPGPVNKVITNTDRRKYECDRNSRHTYTTRYGTEENIYEEITEVSCNLKNRFADGKRVEKPRRICQDYYETGAKQGRYMSKGRKSQSQISLNQSIVEEEVREVQSTHRRVLGQLNLTMEAMLMPNSIKEKAEIREELECKREDLMDDNHLTQITDLDSGFSGSSCTSMSFYGGSNYVKSVAPFRRPDLPRSSIGCGSKVYPMPKTKMDVDMVDYRSAGYCPEGCCSPYHMNGRSLTGLYASSVTSLGSPPDMELISFSGPSGERVVGYQPRDPMSYSQGYQRKDMTPIRRNPNPNTVKSLSFPRGTIAPTSASFSKRSSDGKPGSGGPSWAKRGWKRLTGLATGSTNKVNVLDEPHNKASGWEHGHHHGRASSEDSWCSGSDNELSSGDESSERSATSSTRSNGQLRQTLNKARTLCDKWRPHGMKDPSSAHDGGQPPGRLSRWFSMRRGSSNQYELDNGQDRISVGGKMPLLSEVDEEGFAQSGSNATSFPRRQLPPTLPPPPPNLTPQQLKRRHIVAAIVHSENSYVATLQRLVNDYKKPLEESSPAILSSSKISTLFLRLPEILQCHTLFRIALAEAIRTWDKDERIGDVFVASFSKSIVLDVYSGFINNFSIAMDLAKTEAKRKSALADFLKVKQISSHDRLSFFGLMVKPVQRFPQFILFLQDLLKHTPQGHHDRMSLQLALTQLESLAEMLNERKRESEQFQAFKEMLRHVSGKFARPSLSDSDRYLLREDNVTQLEFNQSGMVTKSKSRRLLLLNDLLVCVSVAPKSADDFTSNERLTLKWSHPVTDIEIQDTSASPTLSRLLTAGLNRSGSLKKEQANTENGTSQTVDSICQEMADLMHDYEVLSRITELVGSLRGTYKELTVDSMKGILHEIQSAIQQKDEAMSWVDSCCLQITLKSKNKEETVTFQTDNPSVKKEWTTELRLAQLALDINNSPAWEIPEEEQRPSTKMPLFVKAQSIYSSKHQTEVRCGCFYTINNGKSGAGLRRPRHQNYLWVCSSDGASSHISILAQQPHQTSQLKTVQSFHLVETRVTCMEFVKGVDGHGLEGDSVWMGTDSCRILIYSAAEPEKEEQVATLTVPSAVIQIRYHGDNVYVATSNGNLLLYQRSDSGSWPVNATVSTNLGADPVSCLLPINTSLYAACGNKVSVHCVFTGEIQRSFSVLHEHVGNVNLMAHSGVGLWISLKNSSTICLYHTETFKHLQDINIASNVLRVTSPPSGQCTNRDCLNNNGNVISVTSLMACKGLLWVGTNVGIALTIPLPRLEGVPIISGRVNISYHAHFGAISFLLALQPRNYVNVSRKNSCDKKALTEKIKHQLTAASPVMLRKKKVSKDGDPTRRMSKTLPRTIFSSSSSSQSSNEACDVYGLYGELMYCKDLENEEPSNTDPIYESLRRSDPDLSALPGKISTLDRRLKMKASRPRSLDLSNWSVESHTSSQYTSSGSEECVQKQKTELNRTNSNNECKGGKGKELKRSESTGALPNLTFDQELVKRRRHTVNKNELELKKKQAEMEKKEEGKVEKCKTLGKYKTVKGSAADGGRRTIITLMGGKGYVYWRQACCNIDKQKSSAVKELDTNDAHIVIWEMKL